jgi:hypothetical protein
MLNQSVGKLDLVDVKFGARVTSVQRYDLLNQVVLVIVKYLNIKVSDQVEVHFIAVVSNAGNKRSALIEHLDLFVEGERIELRPDDHELNLSKFEHLPALEFGKSRGNCFDSINS